ncbi:hypothetical protein BCR42DRAFT_428231 [Absidia repens]|uniref:F-box domain-containing protein n=1 Tax=Absidia repens TaxID=90262 RepID=A0A1X2HYJ9_9FUNG|nr:hypothetical protein BCR42DRAFT_428231 [Absidia repens]
MTDLPFELINHILTFADASSLYEVGHVSHALSYLSQKQVYQHHIQYASIRLWIHQPGTMIHRQIGFDLHTTPTTHHQSHAHATTAEFRYTGEPIPFDGTKPVSVDGCTIIFNHPSSLASKKHYGITYDDTPVVMDTIDSTWTMQKQGQWSMHGQLDQEGRFQPLSLSCDAHLFNPDLLDTLLQQQTIRLKERIQRKKQEQKIQHGAVAAAAAAATTTAPSLYCGLASPLKDTCSSKSFDPIGSSPATTPTSKHIHSSTLPSLFS